MRNCCMFSATIRGVVWGRLKINRWLCHTGWDSGFPSDLNVSSPHSPAFYHAYCKQVSLSLHRTSDRFAKATGCPSGVS